MNEPINMFPCKCTHPDTSHGVEEERWGGYVWMDDIKEEVWQEDSQPVPRLRGFVR